MSTKIWRNAPNPLHPAPPCVVFFVGLIFEPEVQEVFKIMSYYKGKKKGLISFYIVIFLSMYAAPYKTPVDYTRIVN